jgi:RyR domain
VTDERRHLIGWVDACARAAHEVNRAYCLALGDTSQPAWDDAPEWQKSSARNGVASALNGHTPEQSHEGWCAEKRFSGWTYGPVKDPEKKQHPCLVPYAELPLNQRAKDLLFVQTVRAMATALHVVSGGKTTQQLALEHALQDAAPAARFPASIGDQDEA